MRAISSMTFAVGLVLAYEMFSTTFAADPPQQKPKAPRQGYKAPDFTLSALDGSEVNLFTLLKTNPVVLVVLRGYPGYQCPACTHQVADLVARAEKLKSAKARVVLVYPGPAASLSERATEFLKDRKLPEGFTLALDPDYKFITAYGLRWDAQGETAYPSTMVIDHQKTVRFVHVGKTHGDRAKPDEVIKALPGVDWRPPSPSECQIIEDEQLAPAPRVPNTWPAWR